MEENTKQVNIFLTPEEHFAVKVTAVKLGITMSNFMKAAINKAVKAGDK